MVPNSDKRSRYRRKKPEDPMANARYNLCWMGLVATREFAREEGRTLLEEVGSLWPLLNEDLPKETQPQWEERFLNFINRQRTLNMSLKIPYGSIRDMVLRDSIQTRFAVLLTLSMEKNSSLPREEALQKSARFVQSLAKESFDERTVSSSAGRILGFLCDRSDSSKVSPEVVSYMRKNKEFIQEWGNWLMEEEMAAGARQMSQIDERLQKAHEELYLNRSYLERSLLMEFVQSLSAPMYGDILGRLYLQSLGKGEEDLEGIRRDLADLFKELSHFRIPITPIEGEEGRSPRPGWSVGGEVAVEPAGKQEDI